MRVFAVLKLKGKSSGGQAATGLQAKFHFSFSIKTRMRGITQIAGSRNLGGHFHKPLILHDFISWFQ
ncbi:MAG: hypothetical protein ACJA1U_001664 [Bermanella sp.]|jgi:hypothetical protein